MRAGPADEVPCVAAAGDLLGGLTDWESITAAVGPGVRPAAISRAQAMPESGSGAFTCCLTHTADGKRLSRRYTQPG